MSDPEFLDEPELSFTAPVPVDWHDGERLTVGRLGSLAEMVGVEEAEEYLQENSLTRHVRHNRHRHRIRHTLRFNSSLNDIDFLG